MFEICWFLFHEREESVVKKLMCLGPWDVPGGTVWCLDLLNGYVDARYFFSSGFFLFASVLDAYWLMFLYMESFTCNMFSLMCKPNIVVEFAIGSTTLTTRLPKPQLWDRQTENVPNSGSAQQYQRRVFFVDSLSQFLLSGVWFVNVFAVVCL
jgi:hypothetical protein